MAVRDGSLRIELCCWSLGFILAICVLQVFMPASSCCSCVFAFSMLAARSLMKTFTFVFENLSGMCVCARARVLWYLSSDLGQTYFMTFLRRFSMVGISLLFLISLWKSQAPFNKQRWAVFFTLASFFFFSTRAAKGLARVCAWMKRESDWFKKILRSALCFSAKAKTPEMMLSTCLDFIGHHLFWDGLIWVLLDGVWIKDETSGSVLNKSWWDFREEVCRAQQKENLQIA